MNNTYIKALAIPLLLSCFLGIAACVTTSGPVTTPAAPSYSPEPNDPLFWQLWESEHGLG
jgi:hypothetical protein